MRSEADVVVIGAGALGASTAFHLAQRGTKPLVVDKHGLVTQTTPRAAGMALSVQVDDDLSRVSLRSIDKIVRFEEETSEPLEYHQAGSIKAARTDRDASQVLGEVERGKALGVEIALIDAGEAHRLAPFFDPSTAIEMWFCPNDLYLDPPDLPRAYLRAAERGGAELAPETEVTGISRDDDGVFRVATSRGDVPTPVVVLSAGAWTRGLAQLAGTDVAVWPIRHMLWITERLPMVSADQPTVRVIDAKTYVRPCSGGLMFGGYEPDPLQLDVREAADEFSIDDLPLDREPLMRKLREIEREFPALASAAVREFRGGLPVMTPDCRFLVDESEDVPGLYFATGDNVGGLSTSPALGEALAEMVVTGAKPELIAPFAAHRFAGYIGDDARLRRACRASYP